MADIFRYLITIIEIIFVILNYPYSLKISFSIIVIIIFFRKKTKYYEILDLKLTSWIMTICIIIIYFIIFVCSLFLFRLFNIGNTIDLKKLYALAKEFYNTNSFLLIMITVIFYISIILVIYLVSKNLRNTILLHFLKINFYIVNRNPIYQFRPHNWYDNLRIFVRINIYIPLYTFPITVLRYIYPKLKFSTEMYLRVVLATYRNFYGIFLVLFSILYDMLVNHMILTKIYFILPIVFIYQFLVTCNNFASLLTEEEEFIICCILYHKILIRTSTYTIYDNNYQVEHDDVKLVETLLRNAFQRNYTKYKTVNDPST
jgi:hypothetical protein